MEDALKGTWLLNAVLSTETTISPKVDFNRTYSSGEIYEYTHIQMARYGTVWQLTYTNSGNFAHTAYKADTGWTNEAYRTITITSTLAEVTNGQQLLDWLQANATKQGEEPDAPGTTITYDGDTIASVVSGGTATLRCAGKKMRTDITVRAAEQEVVEEYVVANLESAVGTWVFNKSTSKFDSVVEFGITGTATSGDHSVGVRSIQNKPMSGGTRYYIALTAASVGSSSSFFFRSLGSWEYHNGTWYNIDTPPTLVITGGADVNNPELLEWLRNNATLQIEEIPENATKLVYDGIVLASLDPGETGTVDCIGKKMRTNITVLVPEQEALIPSGYIKPSGGLEVNSNGTYNVSDKATVTVNIDIPEAPASYDGKVTITKKVTLDPEFNHYGVIPEGCNYYSANTGIDYFEGESFPALGEDDDYYDADELHYKYINGVWSCEESTASAPVNPVILESINGAPVTALYCIYHGGIGFGVSETETVTIPKSITSIADYAFAWFRSDEVCDNLTTIIYTGTVEQWAAIEKGSNWNYGCGAITVTCTDGTITIPAYGS